MINKNNNNKTKQKTRTTTKSKTKPNKTKQPKYYIYDRLQEIEHNACPHQFFFALAELPASRY